MERVREKVGQDQGEVRPNSTPLHVRNINTRSHAHVAYVLTNTPERASVSTQGMHHFPLALCALHSLTKTNALYIPLTAGELRVA